MSSSDSPEVNPHSSVPPQLDPRNSTLMRKYSDEKIQSFAATQIEDAFFEDVDAPTPRVVYPQKMRKMLATHSRHSNPRLGAQRRRLRRMLTSLHAIARPGEKNATLLNSFVMKGRQTSNLPLGTIGMAEACKPVEIEDTQLAVVRA